jgi:hypothetical protein
MKLEPQKKEEAAYSGLAFGAFFSLLMAKKLIS